MMPALQELVKRASVVVVAAAVKMRKRKFVRSQDPPVPLGVSTCAIALQKTNLNNSLLTVFFRPYQQIAFNLFFKLAQLVAVDVDLMHLNKFARRFFDHISLVFVDYDRHTPIKFVGCDGK